MDTKRFRRPAQADHAADMSPEQREALAALPIRLCARASPRIAYRASVCLQFEGGAEPVWAVAMDISRGGLKVLSWSLAPAGSRVRIAMMAPGGGEDIELRARVAWVESTEPPIRRREAAAIGLEVVGGEASSWSGFRAGYARLSHSPTPRSA